MSETKRKIDWLNHTLEFFVVIVGILIAFQLNKWSTEKGQQHTIDNHLLEIREETGYNKTSFEGAIAFTEANLLKIDSILILIKNKKDYQKINQMSLELYNIGGVYIRRNAYSNLVETGDIKFMKNFESKKRVTNLYEYYKWVKAYSSVTTDIYVNDYYPYLKNNFDLFGGSIQSPEIYQSKLFSNVLGTIKKTSENEIRKYRDCLEEIDKYLDSNIE